MSVLVICEILRLFVDAMTADYKYSLRNSENLTQPIQIQLSKKQRTFSEFFATFLKSSSMVEHFHKGDDLHLSYIYEITDCERRG